MKTLEQDSLTKKIEHALDLIKRSIKQYPKIAVACSFGKDSMVVVHLARRVDPNIPIFSIMTLYKPQETFEHLVRMKREMDLALTVYMVADNIPKSLKDANLEVRLLSSKEFHETAARVKKETGKEIYEVEPDECCRLLKVEPTKVAVRDLDAWICGLRETEGRTRADYQEVEVRGNLVKINPILKFTEKEVSQYLQDNGIPLHPWYTTKFPDGRSYRSLGCATCTTPIYPYQSERDGRWKDTSKCGGECGIHTQTLK